MRNVPVGEIKVSDSSESNQFGRRRSSGRFNSLAATVAIIVIVAILGLGIAIVREYRALQTQSYGRLAEVYVDSFVTPFVVPNSRDRAGPEPNLDQMPSNITMPQTDLLLEVWRPDGTPLYSSCDDNAGQIDDDPFPGVIDLNTVVELVTERASIDSVLISVPYFKIGIPIRHPATGDVVAISRIYTEASEALRERWRFERTVWIALFLVSLGIMALLALSARQRKQIGALRDAEKQIVVENARLRHLADQVRLEAVQPNEQILNLVAAELHDGPVQLLGLISLMKGEGAPSQLPDGTTVDSLIDQVMTELRQMSAGLILPELDGLDAQGVVRLAAERHRKLTGAEVDLHLENASVALDGYRMICLFRVVQEGLMNALRHDGTAPPSLTMQLDAHVLHVVIRNLPAEPTEIASDMSRWHLGINGMRRRLEAFGGTLVLNSTTSEISLKITLPLDSTAVCVQPVN